MRTVNLKVVGSDDGLQRRRIGKEGGRGEGENRKRREGETRGRRGKGGRERGEV